jgi:2'-5' RNA ligase
MDRKPPESLRLFYALWPDQATRAALGVLQAELQGRKTLHGNLHVTLAFLGLQPAERLPSLRQILATLPSMEMTLVIDRIGYFPRHRIAWAGLNEIPENLLLLQRSLSEALVQNEFTFDRQPRFKPHVTLARDAAVPPQRPFEAIHWRVDHLALVQSSTEAEGVGYRVLASRRLNAAG